MVYCCLYKHNDFHASVYNDIVLLFQLMPTLKYGSQYVAMRNPKYKTDKQNNNSKCRIALCAEENLKLSFEFIQWFRRYYGWDCLLPIRTIQRNMLCERFLISFKCKKSISYANMFTCVLKMHTSECLHVSIYTNKSVHNVPRTLSCNSMNVFQHANQRRTYHQNHRSRKKTWILTK